MIQVKMIIVGGKIVCSGCLAILTEVDIRIGTCFECNSKLSK